MDKPSGVKKVWDKLYELCLITWKINEVCVEFYIQFKSKRSWKFIDLGLDKCSLSSYYTNDSGRANALCWWVKRLLWKWKGGGIRLHGIGWVDGDLIQDDFFIQALAFDIYEGILYCSVYWRYMCYCLMCLGWFKLRVNIM